ncbi:GLY1 [Candida oxycetoniae]|uniref:low-specificity L-threonine aldolase n=1 Tax=Candida oxycetoniae TaxID=497107 RepID=A0AAI9SZ94_9ASCO|nr:GLY1 [Candida oxycetoniae]KAI3405898.2 GLY1 [Candida oxycetoniae]
MDLSVFSVQSPAHNDFRSDTFTTPTVSMIQSLSTTTLGDAVYNEDAKTIELEKKVSALTGKEAGLFCVSGTLSNQLAMRVNLTQPPYSILCDYRGHVYEHEAGGMSTLTQARAQPIHPKNGRYLTLKDDILPNFVPDDGEIHGAPTKLICLENTLHGMIFPLDEIKRISQFCKDNNVKLHLDGARLWNASAATGISLQKYSKYFDSVSLCLSKTLGAPVGTVLVGDADFIRKANHFKKQNGGGIRQSGLLASMAIIAIDENFPKLPATHEMAKQLGQLCEEKGIILEHPVETNFVFVDIAANKINPEKLVEISDKHAVKVYSGRVAFHYQISKESFDAVKKVILEAFDELTLDDIAESDVIVVTTKLSKDLIEFFEDDYNFETSLRLLDDLKLQTFIQSISSKLKYKQLATQLFTRYVVNSLLKRPYFEKINFGYSKHGKPFIDRFQFNTSSSNDIIAIAVSLHLPIGIDLSHSEQNISSVNYLSQFEPIFHDSELSQVDTYFRFNHFWTLKESFTKLLGCGLNINLADFYFRVGNEFDESRGGGIYPYSTMQSSVQTRYELSWFNEIEVNAEKLFNQENEFVQGFNNEFYCYSSVLENGDQVRLPVIISIVTPFKAEKIHCLDIKLSRLLLNE